MRLAGDTIKLSTALSKVDKEICDTQSRLKDINKLLKLDSGNTDLMARKQKLLTQAISETKEKLDALKLASQQANEALAKGAISQSQYDALQREIVEGFLYFTGILIVSKIRHILLTKGKVCSTFVLQKRSGTLAKEATLQVRMDADLKEKAEAL